ncbi:MAG TPA: hypothetical protein VFI42_12460 [Thermomicrobiaceae bacterium]|nr:hypothetical protein [Thermomicrobiaceae bacterium]
MDDSLHEEIREKLWMYILGSSSLDQLEDFVLSSTWDAAPFSTDIGVKLGRYVLGLITAYRHGDLSGDVLKRRFKFAAERPDHVRIEFDGEAVARAMPKLPEDLALTSVA